MKTQAEIKFSEIIKKCFHETLKPIGFKKKANNFYRGKAEIGHIINVQKSMFQSKEQISFTVNIGIYSSLYWNSEFNYQGDHSPPIYPTEPVSIIRKRIGDFINGSDKWFDLDQVTYIEPIIAELSELLQNKVIPYFDQLSDNTQLIDYLEKNSGNRQLTYAKFIMHCELGNKEKAKQIYSILVSESSASHISYINEKAKKYKVGI